MIARCARFLWFLLAVFMPGTQGALGSDPPKVGEPLPAIELPVPREASDRTYLGLPDRERFSLTEIRTTLLVIEIFSMYCPYCQREAPEVNALYARIEKDPELKGKIKLIGIAPGNSIFETEVFKKKYQVPFPLFQDEKFLVHKRIGEVRTPYFIVVRYGKGGEQEVVFSALGGLGGYEAFLDALIKRFHLKKEGAS